MVGVNTILVDDPRLTARHGLKQAGVQEKPIRVVVDSKARTPPTAQVFKQPGRTIVAVTPAAPPSNIKVLEKAGAEVLEIPYREALVDLETLLVELGKKEITSVLVEGGGTLLGSFFELHENGLVDKVIAFIAPVIIGGRDAKLAVGGKGAERITDTLRLSRVKIERFGDDMMICGYTGEEKDVYRNR
jgi:diaminohydroxyphosphoribosylaminopyrimidine deaminase/5-amino-6-(5-phosphoribosylamino)uracil reductase